MRRTTSPLLVGLVALCCACTFPSVALDDGAAGGGAATTGTGGSTSTTTSTGSTTTGSTGGSGGCPDGDNDGAPDQACQPGGDCHDGNADVFPTQAKFFAEAMDPTKSGVKKFDYNCDGKEERAPDTVWIDAAACAKALVATCATVPDGYLEGDELCGERDSWYQCKSDGAKCALTAGAIAPKRVECR